MLQNLPEVLGQAGQVRTHASCTQRLAERLLSPGIRAPFLQVSVPLLATRRQMLEHLIARSLAETHLGSSEDSFKTSRTGVETQIALSPRLAGTRALRSP